MTSPSTPTDVQLRAHLRDMAAALEQVRLQELAAMSDEEALRRTRSLTLFSGEPLPSSTSSGLVEQQRLFHRLKDR